VLESAPAVTISVVSHGQADLVEPLLDDLARCADIARVVLTVNVPDREIVVPDGLRDRLVVVMNPRPLGFGANHNQAFAQAVGDRYCVMNPDIRLQADPFPPLLDCLQRHIDAALCAPRVFGVGGCPEDHARRFPTPWSLARKIVSGDAGLFPLAGTQDQAVDWVAGMFLLFRSSDYAGLGGFDDGYFLYYEDVDICARLRRKGRATMLCTSASVVHDARRASHRKLRYLAWHVSSMMRYFRKHLPWLLRTSS
jgi:N-acetylglucosaminyl-diphospho-decaprenol L-rhamnosyltransferase